MIADEPYFGRDAPKSTGTEYFNPGWLKTFLDCELDAVDVQATLVELTAVTVAMAIKNLPSQARNCYICGGGAHNRYLLERLGQALPECGITTTAALGLDADFVEAAAFAWLARERINQREGNIPEVTQARSTAILGGVYAAG